MRKKLIFASIVDYSLIAIVSSTLFLLLRLDEWKFAKSITVEEGITYKADVCSIVIFLLLFVVVSAGMLLALSIKDLAFRNASIGKKIFGLVVVDRYFKCPSKKQLVKRGLYILFEGFSVAICDFINRGDFESWELERFGTRVIEKKFWEKISKS